jgi:hypothetical protein
MLGSSMRDTDEGVVRRLCAGGCGVVLHYKLETSCRLYAPDLYCQDGNSVYRGGHLCNDCETVVADALTQRCEALRRAAQQAERRVRASRVREQVRGRR